MARALRILNPENATIEELKQLLDQTDANIWFADESGFEGDPRPGKSWDKNEQQLLERLDQAIFDVMINPQKAQKTARIGTLL